MWCVHRQFCNGANTCHALFPEEADEKAQSEVEAEAVEAKN